MVVVLVVAQAVIFKKRYKADKLKKNLDCIQHVCSLGSFSGYKSVSNGSVSHHLMDALRCTGNVVVTESLDRKTDKAPNANQH